MLCVGNARKYELLPAYAGVIARQAQLTTIEKEVPMPSFDLRCDPWIPVTCIDGSYEELSLRELIERAPELRNIGGDLPQQALPILRLLIAILRRTFGDPDLNHAKLKRWWIKTWNQGSFDADRVNSYLDRFSSEFNLFGDHPFYQVPDLEYAASKDGGFNPISELLADVPKPDKFLFSMRGKAAPDEISFAEAARWLIFSQAYDSAGIKTPVVGNTHVNKGKVYPPKGIPSTGWLGCIGGVYLEGENLFQTLLWNLVLYEEGPRGGSCLFGDQDDLAPWERAVPSPDYRVAIPTGPVDLETRQSRRMRLVCNEDGTRVVGVICCYGDVMHPVDALKSELMTSWRESKAQQKKLQTAHVPLMPSPHEGGKAIWRGLAPLISVNIDGGVDLRPGVIRWMEMMKSGVEGVGTFPKRLSIHAQGMEYGTQSSVFTNGFDDSLLMGTALLRHDSPAVIQAVALVGNVERAVFELVKLAQEIEKIGGDKRAGAALSLTSDDVREHAYEELDVLFREYLAGFIDGVDPFVYTNEWALKMRTRLLMSGKRLVASAETPLFVTHDPGKKPRYLSEAEFWFRRDVMQILSCEDEGKPEVGGSNEQSAGI